MVKRKRTSTTGETSDPAGSGPSDEERASRPPRKKASPGAVSKSAAVSRKRSPAKDSTSTKTTLAEPSDEEIRTRAYFISERRMRLGLTGDSATDWLDARRQLTREV